MRWQNLTIEASEGSRLPGYQDAVVRRFDAPEALDTNFYEVQARSVINKVPEQSAMPFRWTVNPYRGCSHACTYCTAPETPVLLSNGRSRPIGELRAGDRIVGTHREGSYRRFVDTAVLDHWETIKPAYRVVLADGTELVASGDHRFLSTRGWKHVTGTEQGAGRRPHLTLQTELLGIGATPVPRPQTADYKRGYLTGMIRGDGSIGHRDYVTRTGRAWTHHSFRLALADSEALVRAQAMLEAADVTTQHFTFAPATPVRREIQAISTQRRNVVERVEDLIAWPRDPSLEWRRGFLAGIFDAEGSCSANVVRIVNGDERMLDMTLRSLRSFAFDAVREPERPNGVTAIRIRGGLVEAQRFMHLADPAITRKRSIVGGALKNAADLRVVAIEPVGVRRLVDIKTGTGDFIANGVVSHNCFARPTHKYLDFGAGRDFEKEIVVKVNAPEVLRAQLRRPSWKGEHIAMGTNTDPYQWVESRYRLMPGIWEALRDYRNACSVLTKSPLLLRDIEVMKEIAAVTSISAALSVPTIDREAWRASEPHTPSPWARLEAIGELNRNGIPTGVLIAPLMPGINDDPADVEKILAAAADAGAVSVGGIALHLRGDVRGVFMDWLKSYRPDLVARYEELYASGAYAPEHERRRLARLLRAADAPPAMGFSRDPRSGETRPARWRQRDGSFTADGVDRPIDFRKDLPLDEDEALARRRQAVVQGALF